MLLICLGEWLNGRVAVSKTVGCVFESRLPCHVKCSLYYYRLLIFLPLNTQLQLLCSCLRRTRSAQQRSNRYSVALLLTPRVSPAMLSAVCIITGCIFFYR